MRKNLAELVRGLGEKGGASIYSRVAAKAIKDYSGKLEVRDPKEFLERLEEYGSELIRCNPSMASVRNAVEYILNPLRSLVNSGGSLSECRKFVADRAESFIKKSEEAVRKIMQFGGVLLGDRDVILTHSFSSTVLRILEFAKSAGKRVEVVLTESRPQSEGYELARELLEMGVQVTLIADSAICTVMRKVSKVMIGADSVLADGSIINKVGSLPIALAAKMNNVPFLVAAESFKFDPSSLKGEPPKLETGRAEDLTDIKKFGRTDLLKVWNPVFEVVPASYITALITDLGVLSPQSAALEMMKVLGD